jgi:flagellar protein FlaE
VGGSIDPIEYDVTELRELARVRGDRYVADGFLWTELPESLPPTDGTAEYDRPAMWTGSLEERQKPYLRELPRDEDGRRVARELVDGLVERAGSGAAVEALSYYESLGWLTEAVRDELEDYLLAVGYRSGGSIEDLTRADHIESLARTARLAQLADPGTGPRPATPDEDDRGEAGPEDGDGDGDDDGDDGDGDGDEGKGEGEEHPLDESDRWWDAAVVAAETDDDRPDVGSGTDVDDDTDADTDSGFEFGARQG